MPAVATDVPQPIHSTSDTRTAAGREERTLKIALKAAIGAAA
ncbi:hypothetical protein NR402_03155 [Acidithiobacillus ferrooxidans]|nr:hypothetical protein [Acidithiobacillus ferrooxidans]MCR2829284.1 hypothetical protein [Acidithiobacillus ferrooxidans]